MLNLAAGCFASGSSKNTTVVRPDWLKADSQSSGFAWQLPSNASSLEVLFQNQSVTHVSDTDQRKTVPGDGIEPPTLFHVNVLPSAPFLVIPEVSSERRDYVSIGWLEPPVIPSNKLRVLENATLADFALLTSAMHMAWLRHIGGRLKSDYRYSIGLVYNTFPTPPARSDWSKLEPVAQAILDARASYPDATLADLYDPDLMPPNLRRAHQRLDGTVDRLYRPRKFSSERERIEHLFGLYEKLRAPLEAKMKVKPKRRRIRPRR